MNQFQNKTKIPCSVGILTFNSEKGLRRCLESVAVFDELIICDGGSTDNTLLIAEEFGCKIIFQDKNFKYENNKISDFSGVRNQTLSLAKHDWFLVADSDEYITEDVVAEIEKIINFSGDALPKYFQMLRKYEVDGQIINYAGTYPNYQPKFFNKRYTTKFLGSVHEKVFPITNDLLGYINNPTIVPVEIDSKSLNKKFSYYLKIDQDNCLKTSKNKLFKSIFLNAKGIVSRWFKVFRNRLLYKDNHMPLTFEWAATVYTIRLIFIYTRCLLRQNN